MRYFVFRNDTIEFFFPGKDYAFSGYDDISLIPNNVDSYIWFYQMPLRPGDHGLAAEIDAFADKLRFTASKIPDNRTLLVFTMEEIYSAKIETGNHDVKKAVDRYNAAVFELAAERSNVKAIDFSSFTRRYRSEELVDWKYYFISQTALNPRIAGDFRNWWKQELDAVALKRKKCLVLDLDNTLWGGVLGEDGIDGIRIGGDYPGKAFLYFQEALKELSRGGIMLAVCSKNNEADVLEAWEKNPFMALGKDDFVSTRINWLDKASNIAEIARELNIGLDSIVFVDDNPVERERVRQALPMVAVPDFPEQPYGLMDFYARLVRDYFSVYSLTREDLEKTEQYRANRARASECANFSSMDDYLRSLDIRITVSAADRFNLPRIAQMTQKTNQFNLTTRRYTEQEVAGLIDKGARVWCLGVSDRFGDSGITGTVFVNADGADGESAAIDTLLLSCRILGRGIETAFLKTILGLLRSKGVRIVKARYIPSAKNMQTADFYDRMGFERVSDSDGVKDYTVSLETFDFSVSDIYKIDIKD